MPNMYYSRKQIFADGVEQAMSRLGYDPFRGIFSGKDPSLGYSINTGVQYCSCVYSLTNKMSLGGRALIYKDPLKSVKIHVPHSFPISKV